MDRKTCSLMICTVVVITLLQLFVYSYSSACATVRVPEIVAEPLTNVMGNEKSAGSSSVNSHTVVPQLWNQIDVNKEVAEANIDPMMFEFDYKKRFAIKPAFHHAMARYAYLHNNPTADSKYIVYTPSGQMCNQMRGAISAFLIALLTDRILVTTNLLYGHTSYLDLFEKPSFSFYNKGVRGGKRVAMDNAEMFACQNFRETLESTPTISVAGAFYVGTYIMKNPYYQERMAELFQDGDIARPILAYLFQPKYSIIEKALQLRASLVGVKGDFRKNIPLANRKLFLTYHLRSEFPITDNEEKAYIQCPNNVIPKHKIKDTAVYVATDSLAFVKRMTHSLSVDKGAIAPPNFYSTDVFLTGSVKGGLETALIDLLTASLGDFLFVSPFSSFSRMIMLYAETPNVYLVTDDIMPETDPHFKKEEIEKFCYRFYSKEPCSWHGHLKSCTERLKATSCYTKNMQIPYC